MKFAQQNNPLSNKFMDVAVNILSLSSRLEHFMSVALKPFSLTLQQFNALSILATHYPEPIVLKRMTEQMIDKSSNTSRLVDKLAEKKFAFREQVLGDKRVIHISMTEEGWTLVNEVSKKLATDLENRFAPSEQNETAELIEALKLLRGGM